MLQPQVVFALTGFDFSHFVFPRSPEFRSLTLGTCEFVCYGFRFCGTFDTCDVFAGRSIALKKTENDRTEKLF